MYTQRRAGTCKALTAFLPHENQSVNLERESTE